MQAALFCSLSKFFTSFNLIDQIFNVFLFFPFLSCVQPLCRHVLRNQHKFMHFLQRQIRLCSSRIAQPLENAVDFDENNIKVIDIPKIALQTQSQPIQHEPDNGHLFKVSNILSVCFCQSCRYRSVR